MDNEYKTIRIKEDDYKRLKQIGELSGIKLYSIISKMIDKYIKEFTDNKVV